MQKLWTSASVKPWDVLYSLHLRTPLLLSVNLKIAFWFLNDRKQREDYFGISVIFNIFLYKKSSCLVLHFVKTINSNINIQLKLKENIFSMLSVLQHSTILLALSQHILCFLICFLDLSIHLSLKDTCNTQLSPLLWFPDISSHFTARTLSESLTLLQN